MFSPTSCGKSTQCCHLQDVVNNVQEGDTIYLNQVLQEKHLQCNLTGEIYIWVKTSFKLRTLQPPTIAGEDSKEGIHGVRVVFSNNCSENCNLTIAQSHFSWSSLRINDLDIRIKDTMFKDSFITGSAVSRSGIHGYRHSMRIQDTEFKSSFQMEREECRTLIKNGQCQQLNYVCLKGNWNSFEVLRSNLEGDRQSQVSGIEIMHEQGRQSMVSGIDVMHANIQMFKLVSVEISFMFSAVVIDSSAIVDKVIVSESKFVSNRDGIDIGHGVRYMVVSKSDMNNTGSWLGDGEDFTQCHSALKGSAQSLKVEDSVFAHNHASGMNCKGLALFLRSNVNDIPPLVSFETRKPMIQTVEVTILKSLFYDNVVENCSVAPEFENIGGGAVTFYGLLLSLKIADSTFVRNEACKGAGLYVGISDSWHIGFSQNEPLGQVVSLEIIIDTCTFNENIAEFGGGLMTELTESKLDTGSKLSLLVYNSLFNRNKVNHGGAGICVHYSNVSLDRAVTILIKVSDTSFKENTAENMEARGAGMSTNFTSLSLLSFAMVKTVLNNCTFGSNIAEDGAGISTNINTCSLGPYTVLIFEITYSTYTSNTVYGYGAGIYIFMHSCLLYPASYLVFQITDSSFTSNRAWKWSGAGVSASMDSCSLHAYSYLTLQTTDCTFTYNTAHQYGAGIFTWMRSCSFYPYSSLMLQLSDSTFASNTAAWGAGVSTSTYSCALYPNTSLTLQMTDLTFTSNIAQQGSGIYTSIRSCYLHPDSSLTLQMADSIFTFNGAAHGAGIHAFIKMCTLHPYSFLILQVAHSIFTSNTVESYGGGISTVMQSCSLDANSSLTFRIIGSTFASNKAGLKGASLYMLQIFKDVCVFGEIAVAISDCTFLNNSALSDGGSLYLRILPMTQVQVKQSLFETNQALPGSGLYRINSGFPTCNIPTLQLKTQVLITTHLIQCQFLENIDTAVVVKNKQRYGTFAITKCTFRNNRCIKSLFAEDVFTESDLEIHHTVILRDKNNQRTRSINSQSDAKIGNLTISTMGLSYQRQISVATFSHYITQANSSAFHYQCPAFYQPTLTYAGLTDVGAVMLKATCEACFEGYYIGRSWLVISYETGQNHYCHEQEMLNEYNHPVGTNKLCYTNETGTCIECPHGANCSAGVVSLPNYWGHMTAANRLEFHRCPVGYCCNQASCEGIAQCAAHREGTLCGRCRKGFSESLLSQECIFDEECDDTWVLPLFISWAFCVTLAIIFMGKIEQLTREIVTKCIQRCRKFRSDQKKNTQPDVSDAIEARQTCIDQETTNESGSKVPILWGLLTTQRQVNLDSTGSLKYLQIILYYLQDSALLQVHLALGTKGSVTQKIREILLNFSQLAVDLLDLGLKLCPIQGWTPVIKILAKNFTGPLVFIFILCIYWTVKAVCSCFPNKKQPIRRFWYPKLTAASIFSLLTFYQQIANTTFSLLYCFKSGEKTILFIDGTVTCYQPWQIIISIFAFNWVIAIIPVLIFLPGLLELRLIGTRDFFLACLLPGPMLVYWGHRFYRKKISIHPSYVTDWQDEALAILQKTFVKTTYKGMFPFCWIGFMKIRRLALVLIFTFVSNQVGCVSLMCLVILLFLVLHLKTLPYQDHIANEAYTASLIATLSIGFINIMKAACVEFYLDLDKVKHSLETLDMITDAIFVYCPPAFLFLVIITVIIKKIRISVRKKKAKRN